MDQQRGINLVGYFNGAFGLGETARLYVEALKKASIPHSLVSADSLSGHHHQETYEEMTDKGFIYPINVFCVDPRHIFPMMSHHKWDIFKNKYNIAISFWETNIVPQTHLKPWSYLDELWATTRYNQEHLSISNSIPVHHISHPVRVSYSPERSAEEDKKNFGLPNKFTFLFCFCFYSVVGRKNPMAIVEAFWKAFPNRQDVQVVIKSQNGTQFPNKLKACRQAIKDDPRIIWMDESMPSQKRYDLMNACDCYVSLHRSEGFGQTMAEAMLLEKPVIATGYSGNLDYMTDENSFLCPYHLVTIGKGHPPYSSKGIWADVDVDQAAYWMNYVVTHPIESKAIAKKGRASILKNLSFDVIGQQIAKRIAKIPLNVESKSAPFIFQKYRFVKKSGDCFPFFRPFVRAARKSIKSIVRNYR